MEIDLVYLWVNGNDPTWRAKKRAYIPDSAPQQEDVSGTCRYIDNDELKFSLRSVERFAPWIRRIFIITDEQCPEWLDTSNPRIRIVDHREIVPAEYLPVFNSCVLELHMWKIPGLAEHFLYANDDMFFGAPTDPGFFFDTSGRPFVRLKIQSIRHHLNEIYPYTIYRAQQEIRHRFGKNYLLSPHHNIDAYRKSDFEACCNEFRELVEQTSRSRFRGRENLQRSILSYYALALKKGVLRKVSRFNGAHGLGGYLTAALGKSCRSDSRCIPITIANPSAILDKYHPALFCVNDTETATIEDRMRTRDFLLDMFPGISTFEKQDQTESTTNQKVPGIQE